MNAFKCRHVYLMAVPEATCGVVEYIRLRRALLNDTSISSSRQRHQHSLRQLRQTLSGQSLLQTVFRRQVPQNAYRRDTHNLVLFRFLLINITYIRRSWRSITTNILYLSYITFFLISSFTTVYFCMNSYMCCIPKILLK